MKSSNRKEYDGLMIVPDNDMFDYDIRAALAYKDKIGRPLIPSELESFRIHARPKELIYKGARKIALL